MSWRLASSSRRSSIRSDAKPVTTTAFSSPALLRLPSAMSRIVRSPSTGSRVFGRSRVSSPSRRPAPAASTMPIIEARLAASPFACGAGWRSSPCRSLTFVLLVFVGDGLLAPPEPSPAGDALGDERRREQAGGDVEPCRQRVSDEQNVSEHEPAVPAKRQVPDPARGGHALVAKAVDEVVVAKGEHAYKCKSRRLGIFAPPGADPQDRRVLAQPDEGGDGPAQSVRRLPARGRACNQDEPGQREADERVGRAGPPGCDGDEHGRGRRDDRECLRGGSERPQGCCEGAGEGTVVTEEGDRAAHRTDLRRRPTSP